VSRREEEPSRETGEKLGMGFDGQHDRGGGRPAASPSGVFGRVGIRRLWSPESVGGCAHQLILVARQQAEAAEVIVATGRQIYAAIRWRGERPSASNDQSDGRFPARA